MRFLFVKHSLAWPRSSGQDVHAFQMMKALGELGHQVSLATVLEPSAAALDGLRIDYRLTLNGGDHDSPGPELGLTRLQERFRSYYGVDRSWIANACAGVARCQPDAVVGVGLGVLPYLAAIRGPVRVWYAADEWVWHHLSQVRVARRGSWGNLRAAVVKGLYERAFAGAIDRAWVVSDAERRAMRWIAGVSAVDTLPNGVDGEHFFPRGGEELPRSAIFWGRLDFGPNIQALEWFCRQVWPAVRRAVPDARFTIVGYNPSPAVTRLALNSEGIALTPDLPDLRAEANRHALVVLPFVSGGGIKNKLLEAASLGKAIVCSRRACGGLRGSPLPLVQVGRNIGDWKDAIVALWADPERRQRLGADARRWVTKDHTWTAAARGAVAGIDAALAGRCSP